MGDGRQDAFRSKLARLRRDGARGADAPKPVDAEPVNAEPISAESRVAHAPLPTWLRANLERRQTRGASALDAGASNGATGGLDGALTRAAALWETTLGDPSELHEETGRAGSFAARTTRIPVQGTRHGAWGLDEVEHADPAVIARLTGDPALADLDLRRAIFLDTETSGLGGGAGVYVYMVGLGWFEPDGTWVSWQGFLRHPGEERALLDAVAERVGAADALVSFFGKSFDRHRLEDKMRIVGVTPPFEGRAHLDLYHPLRRLTRGAFADARLQTMERELLGFRRERDLPGALAPAAWFDYLAGRPHLLEGVFVHNHEDVLSLAVLGAYLGRAAHECRACGTPLSGPSARRAAAFAETAATADEARAWAERALSRDAAGEDRRRMLLLAAEHARRAGDVDAARAHYRAGLEEDPADRIAVRLFRGASMLLERALDDRANALRMAERALETARRHRLGARDIAELERRVERLRSA